MNSTSQISQLSRFREKVSIASGIARLTGSFVSVLFYSYDSAIYIIYIYVCMCELFLYQYSDVSDYF